MSSTTFHKEIIQSKKERFSGQYVIAIYLIMKLLLTFPQDYYNLQPYHLYY